MGKWPATIVHTSKGNFPGIAPAVISASRATDIPAFHAKWLMERLQAGYCIWQNPFNAMQKMHVSFANTRAIVFWTKDPAPLMPHLPQLDNMGYKYYFQYTLNNYESEGLEPRVRPLGRRIETFHRLAERIGKDKVIWRMDPIIMGGGISVEKMLERAMRLMEKLSPFTHKLVFSFLDMYRKTKDNLKKINHDFKTPNMDEQEQFARGLALINSELAQPLILASCAETANFPGIEHGRCIDPALLEKLCPGLWHKSGKEQSQAGQNLLFEDKTGATINFSRDTGQRPQCGCAPAKDIGRYNTCMHLCAYCYANSTKNTVIRSMNGLRPGSERL